MADETDEIDVDIDVCEQPKHANFPRRPNVVSRRGHRIKLDIGIHELPEGTEWVVISAKVFNYGPEHLGPGAHASRSRKLWGKAGAKAFEIKPEELPTTFEIVASKEVVDEHLGQGPYEAVITVTASDEEPENPEDVTEGDEFSIEFESM